MSKFGKHGNDAFPGSGNLYSADEGFYWTSRWMRRVRWRWLLSGKASELWERFQLQAYAAIRQRIDIQCKLSHFWSVSGRRLCEKAPHVCPGANRDIFSDGAIDEIYRYSSGAARLINKACPHCLFWVHKMAVRLLTTIWLSSHFLPWRKGWKIKEKLVYTHKSIANKPSFGGFKKNKQAVVKNKVN